MALTIIDTTDASKTYLNEFLNRRTEFLSSFLTNYASFNFVSPGWVGRTPTSEVAGWKFLLLANYSGNMDSTSQITGLS